MSFVDTSDPSRYPWYVRAILKIRSRRSEQLPEPVRLWLRLPLAFLGFQLMYRTLERKNSPLNGRLRALVRTRIAQLNHCHFCIDLNAAQALQRGVTPDELQDLHSFGSSPRFSDAEKAALAYAETITGSAIEIDSEMVERLRAAFGDDGIIELAVLAAHQNLSAKFNSALGAVAEGYCPIAMTVDSSRIDAHQTDRGPARSDQRPAT